MAGTTGLEPATSAVTGQRSNQLSYVPNVAKIQAAHTCWTRLWNAFIHKHNTSSLSAVSPPVNLSTPLALHPPHPSHTLRPAPETGG
jgi:hypothetical protein